MRFPDLLAMSVNNLRRRKLRTALTVLGDRGNGFHCGDGVLRNRHERDANGDIMRSYGGMTAI